MSFFLRTASRAAVATRPATVCARTFSISAASKLKEGSGNNLDAAEHNEAAKQDQLKKQKEGKGHWKPELASHSEEAVAADRNASGDNVKEMQEKTKNKAEEKHK